ncbi:MAG: hypothetical protein WAZ12_01015 [Candidatus Absconditicoccaceae bacterium]
MLFHIIGVKEDGKSIDNNIDNDEQLIVRHNVDILIESIDINEARRVLEIWGIIMISIKTYPESENNFGKIYLKANCDGKSIRIINYMDDLYESASFFCNIGLEIQEINYLNDPESDIESKKILEEAKIYVDEQKKRMKELMEKKKLQKENIFSNQELVKIRSVIDEAIARGAELVDRTIGIIDIKKIKKLKDLRGELSKLRMGTNQIKIVNACEEYLNLMENIELEFLEKKKNELGNLEILNKDSVISNIDVMKEYARFFKAIKTKGIGGSIKNEYGDYITFGLGGIYIRFLSHDLIKKFSNIKEVIYKIYDWMEFILIAIILEIVIYMIFGSIGKEIELKNFVLLSNIGIVGIVLYFIKFIRRKNIMYLIILIPIIILICVVLIRNLRINLAL